jgi:hypothetical protein
MPRRIAHPRLLRAAGFSAAALTLAALAHRAGGGPAPDAGVLLLGAAALLAAAYALAGRPRSTAVIAGLVATSQVGLHLAWSSTGPQAGSLAECVAHELASPLSGGAMTACHALAALALAVLLERGERWTFAAARSLARRTGGASPLRVRLLGAEPPRPARRPAARAVPPWRRPLAGGRATCGPPARA